MKDMLENENPWVDAGIRLPYPSNDRYLVTLNDETVLFGYFNQSPLSIKGDPQWILFFIEGERLLSQDSRKRTVLWWTPIPKINSSW